MPAIRAPGKQQSMHTARMPQRQQHAIYFEACRYRGKAAGRHMHLPCVVLGSSADSNSAAIGLALEVSRMLGLPLGVRDSTDCA